MKLGSMQQRASPPKFADTCIPPPPGHKFRSVYGVPGVSPESSTSTTARPGTYHPLWKIGLSSEKLPEAWLDLAS